MHCLQVGMKRFFPHHAELHSGTHVCTITLNYKLTHQVRDLAGLLSSGLAGIPSQVRRGPRELLERLDQPEHDRPGDDTYNNPQMEEVDALGGLFHFMLMEA